MSTIEYTHFDRSIGAMRNVTSVVHRQYFIRKHVSTFVYHKISTNNNIYGSYIRVVQTLLQRCRTPYSVFDEGKKKIVHMYVYTFD